MKSNKFLLLIVALFSFGLSQQLFAQGQILADPYASGIGNYANNLPTGTAVNVDFEIGNGSSASGPIAPNTVEWTLNFPVNILTVGVGVFPAGSGLYEFSRTITSTTVIVLIRNNTTIPAPTPFIPQDFVFTYPVTGFLAGLQGTMSSNVRRLPGFSSQGDIDVNNDNASSPIMFSVPTPVTLTNFAGSLSKDLSSLTWTVMNESGVESYEVLRSINSTDFISVGTVAASNSRAYHLDDNVAGKGSKFFYKLKINESSKEINYSKVVVLRKNDADRITIYPNPSSDVVNISTLTGTETISILSIDGRKLLEQAAIAGNNTVNISKLASGNYSLMITNGAEVRTFKLGKN